MRYLLCTLPVILAVLGGRWAGAAAGLCASGALLLWWVEHKDPPRLFAWVITLAGFAVAGLRASPQPVLAMVLPLGVLLALEIISRRMRREDPPPEAVLIALLCALATAWMGFSGGHAFRSGDVPQRIIAIGDSLTSGIPDDGAPQKWPHILEAKLGSGAKVVTLAYPGDTAAESLRRWESEVKSRRWITADPAWQPDMAIIFLGGNNIRSGAGRGAMQEELRAWVDALKPTGARIVFVAVPGALVNDPYSGAWADVARESGGEVIPESMMRGIWTGAGLTLPDRIHLTAQGQEAVAQGIYEHLGGN